MERVTEPNFTFPAVTICARIPFIRSHYKNETLTSETIIVQSNYSMKNFLVGEKFSTQAKEVLQETTSPSNTNSEQMGYEFFKMFYFQYEFECLRFNGAIDNQPVLINRTDAYLQVNITNRYRQNISETEYFVYKQPPNLAVFIGDNYINSFFQTSPILFANGKGYLVNIVKSETQEKLEEPYSSCERSKNDKPYRKKNCNEKCVYNKLGTEFNCTYDGLLKIDGLKECRFSEMLTNFAIIDLFHQDCEKECPSECESSKFNVQSSIEYDKTDNSSSITMLKFTVTDFSFLKITQIPKTNFFSFISADIGGALGLFMGISVLNFIEMLEFIFDIFSISFSC